MGIPAELDLAVVVVESKRAMLVDKSVKARATGSSIEPKNEGIVFGVVLRFDKIVEEVTATL